MKELISRSALFTEEEIILNSGQLSDFKIECDALTQTDIKTLVKLIRKKFTFRRVVSVPTGGNRLALALSKYMTKDSTTTLIVDDVLTTGNSIEKARKELNELLQDVESDVHIIGVVIFARGKCPEWVTPMFQMWD